MSNYSKYLFMFGNSYVKAPNGFPLMLTRDHSNGTSTTNALMPSLQEKDKNNFMLIEGNGKSSRLNKSGI